MQRYTMYKIQYWKICLQIDLKIQYDFNQNKKINKTQKL